MRRLSMLDLVDGGSQWQEVVELAKDIEKAGASIINTGTAYYMCVNVHNNLLYIGYMYTVRYYSTHARKVFIASFTSTHMHNRYWMARGTHSHDRHGGSQRRLRVGHPEDERYAAVS